MLLKDDKLQTQAGSIASSLCILSAKYGFLFSNDIVPGRHFRDSFLVCLANNCPCTVDNEIQFINQLGLNRKSLQLMPCQQLLLSNFGL